MHLDYKQPDFYHFSEDSPRLAKVAASIEGVHATVLDLCAGCGVVGIEYWNLKKRIDEIYFLERQSEYKDSLEQNIKQISNTSVQCSYQHFQEITLDRKFDVILCNPPFFALEASRPSENSKRNLCRLMPKAQMVELLIFVRESLSRLGRAYLVLPLNSRQWDEALRQSNLNKRVIETNDATYIVELV